jgi:hypothetical protein
VGIYQVVFDWRNSLSQAFFDGLSNPMLFFLAAFESADDWFLQFLVL